jgi:hypothetical protein
MLEELDEYTSNLSHLSARKARKVLSDGTHTSTNAVETCTNQPESIKLYPINAAANVNTIGFFLVRLIIMDLSFLNHPLRMAMAHIHFFDFCFAVTDSKVEEAESGACRDGLFTVNSSNICTHAEKSSNKASE